MNNVKLNMIPEDLCPIIHVSQYDKGRKIRLHLFENKTNYVLDGTEVLSVVVRKPDNTLVSLDIANVFEGKSYVDFFTTEQMCACAGQAYGEFTISKNGTSVSSKNFVFLVEGAPDEGGITSQSEINNLDRQIDDYLDETLPDEVEEVALAVVESVAPSIVASLVPDEVSNVAPSIVAQLVPTEVASVAPSIVNELVPPKVAEVAPSVLAEVAPPIVTSLVTQTTYTKDQTNDAIFNRVNDIAVNKSNYAWELGSVTSSGTKSTSTTTVRTPFIRLQKGTEMYVDPDYMYRAYRYTQPNESSFVEFYDYSYSSLHWITGPFVIPIEGYYILTVRKRDNSTIPSGNEQIVGNKLVTSENLSLNALKQHISMDIFAYNLTALDNYICNIAQLGGDVVLHLVTDIHGGYTDTYPVINYLARSGIADYFFELGDVIKSTYPTRKEAADYLREAYSRMDYGNKGAELVYLQGNHDTNPLNGTDTSKNITQEMFYGLSKARPKAFNQPTDKAYGYIDVEHAKVRLIFLNTSDIYSESTGEALVTGKKTMVQQGQIDWFTGVALDLSSKAVPSDWSVIILTHDALSQVAGGMFGDILTAFMNGSSASGNYNLTVDDYSYTIHVSCDYSGQGGGTVICEVNGHHHKDMIKELGHTGIMQVFIACEGDASACYDDNGTTVYYDRVVGTTDEHLIDTLILDKTNRKVYFKRFGVGSDREITY